MKCRRCEKEFYVIQAIQGVFCSAECRYLYKKNVPPDTPNTVIPFRMPEKTPEEIEEDAGLAWQKAGMKFEAITKRALAREITSASQQSIIISGNGASMTVKRDALIIKHGTSYSSQEVLSEEFYRAMHLVRRIVWCAATGNLSYAALKWCSQQKIDVLVLDKDGKILFESNPNRVANIRIKRAQYTLLVSRQAEVAKWLILGKVLEQYKTYQVLADSHTRLATGAFTAGLDWLSGDTSIFRQSKDLDQIRVWEARVAAAYFDAWRDIPLQWAKSDREKIPDHWKIIGDRNSPLTSGNTGGKAVRPAQAILNYAYGILEHVSRASLLAVGLDISVGILHADKVGRDSLVYDLMEFGRGTVDSMVLAFLRKTEFHKGDFTQVGTGEVRLHPELARAIVATCSITPDVMLNHAVILRNMIVGDQSADTEESDLSD
jgi:CRISPR-associated protein Cas1